MSMAASPLVSSLGPLVVMGVSGCGKTSVGKLLASQLGYRFIEGDGRHPQANVDKMTAGIALDDHDRKPWLENLGDELRASADIVISCSALKRSYRNLLRERAARPIRFVFLQGARATLAARLSARKGHSMPLSLLDSQLRTLELPVDERDVITIEIDQPVERIASIAIAHSATIAYRCGERTI